MSGWTEEELSDQEFAYSESEMNQGAADNEGISEAIEVLEQHNKWRRGAEIPMQSPAGIGQAIDLVIAELKRRIG